MFLAWQFIFIGGIANITVFVKENQHNCSKTSENKVQLSNKNQAKIDGSNSNEKIEIIHEGAKNTIIVSISNESHQELDSEEPEIENASQKEICDICKKEFDSANDVMVHAYFIGAFI